MVRAWRLEQDVSKDIQKNESLERRNAGLAAEVRDLKTGTEAIEERARYELGMVKKDEVFFQVVEDKPGQPAVRKK